MNLRQYIEANGRGSISALAKAIRAHAPDVSRWASGERPVPEKAAVAIERVTCKQVTRQELRPSDWREIWPELEDFDSQIDPALRAARAALEDANG